MKQLKNKILITGVAGFIGFHIAEELLKHNEHCIGIDNINNYYDKKLKLKRLSILKKYKNFSFFKVDLSKNLTSKNIKL